MSDVCEFPCHNNMCSLPTELILNIFIYLPAKDLIKCRQICLRWKLIIDSLARSDDLWRMHCKTDFGNIYRVARLKAKPGLLWFHLYRSLALWPRLAECREETDEFASASCISEEIRNFEILENGVLGVHKKGAIVYYDIESKEVSIRGPITGDYSRYTENDAVIVIMSYHLNLFVIRKVVMNSLQESNTTFDNVKLFILTGTELYFVTIDEEIFVCKYLKDTLTATYITRCEDGIMSLGYSNECLNILTFQRNIYSLVDNELFFICSLGPASNLLHQLRKYNFLEQLDWRIYFQWMYVLNHYVPEGPLRDIIIIKPYGDAYLVGSNWGVLRIYYAPYSQGQFDIFNTQPVKQYNFMERSDCPVLSTCPILQIDIIEGEDGHSIIVAMPKKIAVLNLSHNFKRTTSLAMVPYSEVQKLNM